MALNIQEHYFEAVSQLSAAFKYLTIGILCWIMLAILVHPAAAVPFAFNESLPGERNLAQNFTFTMSNVSGTFANCVYQYTVYDYREIGRNFSYYSVNWGQWFKQDADPGKKFIAVWVRGRMAGTSYIGWGQEFFSAWVWGNQTIKPEPVLMQDIEIGSLKKSPMTFTKVSCNEVRVSEDLTGTDSWNDNETGRRLPAVIRELDHVMSSAERGTLTRERYGWKDEIEMDRMVPGEMWDGYILFQVPISATAEDIQIAGNFRAAGAGVWNIRDREIIQDSPEKYIMLESIQLNHERETGIRLPDREPGRIMG